MRWVVRGTLRAALTALALAVCAVSGGGCAAPEDTLSGKASGWNVLLLSIDTLRADRLASYGSAERDNGPAMDRLLARGVRFERAVAPRSATWPSLASALTGLYPSAHGLINNGYSFTDEIDMLPKALQRAGYRTGAFLRNMCRANHQGWDALKCVRRNAPLEAMAIDWVAALPAEQPYLLWVHYMGPHRFYANGGDLAQRVLDPGYDGILAPRKKVFRQLSESKQRLTPRDVEHLDAMYDASVMATDGQIAKLLLALGLAGRLERTLVVFFSDHGEELYDHNSYIYHSCSVYESTLHVPMGIVARGLLEPGQRIVAPVELLDVAPTVLDLLGLPPLAEQQGRSLVALLDRPDADASERAAFSEYGDSELHTVIAGGWKLIDNPDGMTPRCDTPDPNGSYPIARSELYHLATDPAERSNLAHRYPEKVAELREQIAERFRDGIDRAVPQVVPEDLKEELRELGYLVD